MPPKTADRLKQESEAQRARAAALEFLAKSGGGPSQKEIAQQQKEREKWANATSQAIQEKQSRVAAAAKAAVMASHSGGHVAAPMRDNTLEAMATQRAKSMHNGIGSGGDGAQARGISRRSNNLALASSTRANALPSGWEETSDPVSGDKYYWNEITKETTWNRPPSDEKDLEEQEEDEEEEVLEDGWEPVEDSQSKTTYYWNRETNDTTWTKPVKQIISLEQAREAKSKLDAILAFCGGSNTKYATTATITTQKNGTVAATRKREQHDGEREVHVKLRKMD